MGAVGVETRLPLETDAQRAMAHEMDFALNISDRVVFMEGGHLQLDVSPHRLRDLTDTSEGLQRARKFMGMTPVPT